MAGIAATPGPAGFTTFVRVDDVTAASERVTAAGGHVLGAPVLDSSLARTALVSDRSGIPFGLWEPVSHGGAQLVNAPGTWNWSNLAAPDPQDAIDFYGEVFGWAAATPMGEGVWMFRRPGYGDVLAERNPALRELHDQPGVPPGFSDAVAWMTPVTDPVTTGWSVTFAVDDADDVANRAAELGAITLAPPRDEGPTRIALLLDPQGAVLTVSHYSG